MKRFVAGAFLLAAGAAFTEARASEGHFDVFVGAAGSQTAYGGIDVDDGDVTLNERVFESEMGDIGTVFISDEPGFNHPESDAVLPPGVTSLADGDEIFVRKLTSTFDGATSDLFFWDGTGAPAFAPAVDATFDIVTDPGDSIGTAGAGGGFDDHPLYELGNGGSLPAPGIYLGAFEVQVGVLDPSDLLYLVMGTEGLITADFLGITQGEFDMLTDEDLDEELEEVIEAAVGVVELSLIPEPGTLALVSFAGLALAARRR
ncbi:hypothetical protein MalM25_20380 [Planctomycetes bacterium MalM25]|nr:hypothetical protein MalM25_20380 [Planctomycetes bacterium MalM25]